MDAKDNKPAEVERALAEQAKQNGGKRQFEIRAKGPHLFGEKHGFEFKGGKAITTDAIRAHAALEWGYEVVDARTGEPAFPNDKPKDETEPARK